MKMVNIVRSLVFDGLFYPITLAMAILGAPSLLRYSSARWVADRYVVLVMFLIRHVLGIRCDFHATPRAQNTRGRILAVKHQSMWETFALRYYYPDAVGVAKQSLFLSPFGWYLHRLGFIPVNRSGGAKALQKMMRTVQQRLDEGIDVIIYPEGTRTSPSAPPRYKSGIYGLYRYCGAEVLPIAHNSGVFWRKNPLRRHPGEVGMRACPVIAQGLDKQAFMTLLEERIEGAYQTLNRVQDEE